MESMNAHHVLVIVPKKLIKQYGCGKDASVQKSVAACVALDGENKENSKCLQTDKLYSANE